jgi:hypothetical protein
MRKNAYLQGNMFRVGVAPNPSEVTKKVFPFMVEHPQSTSLDGNEIRRLVRSNFRKPLEVMVSFYTGASHYPL